MSAAWNAAPSALAVVKAGCTTLLWVALPLLAATAVAGLLASVLRAFTQLEDAALTLAAKLAAFTLTAALAAPWIWRQTETFLQLVRSGALGSP